MKEETYEPGEHPDWHWHPPLPLERVPVLVFPPRLTAAIRYLFSPAYLGSVVIPFGGSATLTWFFLQPDLAASVHLEFGWIAQLFIRNLLMMLVIAGGLHFYFHVFKIQGSERKYSKGEIDRNNPRFFLSNQVWDNMFWTLTSGITIWTAYEVLFFWAYANNYFPYYLDIRNNLFVFLAMFWVIPFFNSIHFHFVHRLVHSRALFKIAHAVHHRNITLGPWSGLSMHPIEHLLYLSSVFIHVILPSHPIHVLFNLHWNALGAAVSHTGYEALTIKGRPVLYLTSFHHQLHHRHLDCNYGNPVVAMDKLFDCDHNGTNAATIAVKQRQLTKSLQRP